ncbi:MAG: glycoside-pentoside-hexuronide (GPH):cation symporter [Treponema sp.]|jgi:GPH family glycoside/pentoside/hexuronide:cation symporter|nr:glycoside-pentoside-hexuronide (GPH):cation symporter [Treponema sp.]
MAERLSVKQKLGFGICDLGGNLFFTLMGFWALKYLTDVVGLAAAWAGAAVMAGKAWDAVTDPAMGYISDRTATRWGRRRPYLLFGAAPMMLSMWFFFTRPSIANPALLFLWAVFALMLLNTAATVINVPYSSLTPELTSDYHEKTSLNGYRFGCAVFGTMIGAAAALPLVQFFAITGRRVFAESGTDKGWSVTGLFLGAIMALTALLTFFNTREKRRPGSAFPSDGFFSTYREVFTNRSFVRLLAAYALHIIGITFVQSILSYYTEYVYQRPDLTPLAMFILLLTAMIFIPVSVLVSKRLGKKRTYQICFVILASGCMIVFLLGRLLGPWFFLGLMAYAGAGVGFSYVSPWAMVPDTIEFDAARSGERKEGAYYGIWTFVSKLGTSLSVFVSGFILDLGGYAANMRQGEKALSAITVLIGPIPAFVFIAALFCIQFYTLDEDKYRKILASR